MQQLSFSIALLDIFAFIYFLNLLILKLVPYSNEVIRNLHWFEWIWKRNIFSLFP